MLYESGRSGPWPGHDTETIRGTMYTCVLHVHCITYLLQKVCVRMCMNVPTTLACPVAYAACQVPHNALVFLLYCS